MVIQILFDPGRINFNKELIKKILISHGISVETAPNGIEAVRLALLINPDLIIMDMHMPIMGGIEATEKLREEGSHLPIIALTANVITTEHQILLDAGVNKVLLKPINDSQLIESIFELTDREVDSNAQELSKVSDGFEVRIDAKDEIIRLTSLIFEQFKEANYAKISEIVHQLTGIAGLYEIPEIENTSIELGEYLSTGEYCSKEIWNYYWRLYRLASSEV